MSMILAMIALQATPADPAAEVRAVIDAEQAAFFGGKCEETVAFWSEDLRMVVEGQQRAGSREELLKLCRNVMKMVADGRIPSGSSGPKVVERTIEMLSDDTAYETVFRLTPAGDRSSVTKIVVRGPGGWKIWRMHEAIARATTAAPETAR